jgi:hypothetical protein
MAEAAEYTLEFLLEFNGRIHYFDSGYWLKIEIGPLISRGSMISTSTLKANHLAVNYSIFRRDQHDNVPNFQFICVFQKVSIFRKESRPLQVSKIALLSATTPRLGLK